jgi:hypothetical protein
MQMRGTGIPSMRSTGTTTAGGRRLSGNRPSLRGVMAARDDGGKGTGGKMVLDGTTRHCREVGQCKHQPRTAIGRGLMAPPPAAFPAPTWRAPRMASGEPPRRRRGALGRGPGGAGDSWWNRGGILVARDEVGTNRGRTGDGLGTPPRALVRPLWVADDACSLLAPRSLGQGSRFSDCASTPVLTWAGKELVKPSATSPGTRGENLVRPRCMSPPCRQAWSRTRASRSRPVTGSRRGRPPSRFAPRNSARSFPPRSATAAAVKERGKVLAQEDRLHTGGGSRGCTPPAVMR